MRALTAYAEALADIGSRTRRAAASSLGLVAERETGGELTVLELRRAGWGGSELRGAAVMALGRRHLARDPIWGLWRAYSYE